MARSNRNNSNKPKYGAKMGRGSKSGNRSFSGWNNWDEKRGFLSVVGVITDEAGTGSSGKEWHKCVCTLKWHASGVKKTESGFYYPATNSVMIPEWNFTLSFNKNFFG